MSRFVRKEVRYRHGAVTEPSNSAAHIDGKAVTVGHAYHLEGDADFRRDLEQSLADIVKKRLQDAEDEAIALVKIAEEAAERNAKEIADTILNEANAQAKAMIEAAEAQVTSIQEAAHELGFKTGFEEGYSDATTQVESETVELLKGVHLLTEQAYQTEKQVLKNFEKNAVELIRHLAKRVLQRELTDSPETLLHMVQQAVQSLYLSGKVKIVVGAQVLQEIRAYSPTTEASLAQLNRFEFIADPTLDAGQLFIIGEEGCFDLSPEAQVEQLLEPVEKALTLPRPDAPEAIIEAPEVATDNLEPPTPSVEDPLPEPFETVDSSLPEIPLPLTETVPLAPDMAVSEASIMEVEPNTESNLDAVAETVAPPPVESSTSSDPKSSPAKPEVQPFAFPELEDIIPPDDKGNAR